MTGASSSISLPTASRKNKRKVSLKSSNEQDEDTSTSLKPREGSSHALGGGRHPFPHAQKVYIRKSKSLSESVISNEMQELETTETPVNPIQDK
jgi:hypothetical protein